MLNEKIGTFCIWKWVHYLYSQNNSYCILFKIFWAWLFVFSRGAKHTEVLFDLIPLSVVAYFLLNCQYSAPNIVAWIWAAAETHIASYREQPARICPELHLKKSLISPPYLLPPFWYFDNINLAVVARVISVTMCCVTLTLLQPLSHHFVSGNVESKLLEKVSCEGERNSVELLAMPFSLRCIPNKLVFNFPPLPPCNPLSLISPEPRRVPFPHQTSAFPRFSHSSQSESWLTLTFPPAHPSLLIEITPIF